MRVSDVALLRAWRGGVDRQAYRLVAGGFGAGDEQLGDFVVEVVELEPERAVGDFCDFFDGVAGAGGQRVERPEPARGGGCGALAVRVDVALAAGGGNHDGEVYPLPQDFHGGVPGADVHEESGVDGNLVERLAVAPDGDLIRRARVHERPLAMRHDLFRHGFHIEKRHRVHRGETSLCKNSPLY